MKAAILRSFGAPPEIDDMPIPTRAGQEVLVQVRGSGSAAQISTSPRAAIQISNLRSCLAMRSPDMPTDMEPS